MSSVIERIPRYKLLDLNKYVSDDKLTDLMGRLGRFVISDKYLPMMELSSGTRIPGITAVFHRAEEAAFSLKAMMANIGNTKVPKNLRALYFKKNIFDKNGQLIYTDNTPGSNILLMYTGDALDQYEESMRGFLEGTHSIPASMPPTIRAKDIKGRKGVTEFMTVKAEDSIGHTNVSDVKLCDKSSTVLLTLDIHLTTDEWNSAIISNTLHFQCRASQRRSGSGNLGIIVSMVSFDLLPKLSRGRYIQ